MGFIFPDPWTVYIQLIPRSIYGTMSVYCRFLSYSQYVPRPLMLRERARLHILAPWEPFHNCAVLAAASISRPSLQTDITMPQPGLIFQNPQSELSSYRFRTSHALQCKTITLYMKLQFSSCSVCIEFKQKMEIWHFRLSQHANSSKPRKTGGFK